MNTEVHPLYKKIILEELWLIYYNDTLLAKGVITESIHRMMSLKIHQRTRSLLEKNRITHPTKTSNNIIKPAVQ